MDDGYTYYIIELAVCYSGNAGGQWDLEIVRLRLEGESREATEGEIWEAACEKFENQNPNNDHVAIGLYSWLEVEPADPADFADEDEEEDES